MMDSKRSSSNRPRRPGGRYVTTRSGRNLKVNRSVNEKWTALREAKSRRRVERLIGLPKARFKRLLWRLQPKRLAAYWFSRDGGIMALKVMGISILLFFILTLGVFAFFRKDLPNLTDISGGNLGGTISYYDRSGQNLLFQDYNAVKRVPVQSQEISHYVKEASVAVEDRDFYKHRGFDVKGIGRAAYNDFFHRGSTQGGSTITQQLVKLTQDWTQQRSFTRKAKELILAVELERTYTKDQILTGYLNTAPYGGVDYGVQAAASDYFHKSAKELTLPESAMLAAIPKSPAIYSPYNKENFDRDAFIGRYSYVLDSMVRTGKISKKEADVAKKYDVLAEVHEQQPKYAGIRAPYFVLAAKNELTTEFIGRGPGSAKVGGWKVITTMDMNLQNIAEQKVESNRRNALSHGADAEALVAEDVKTGQMVALVGGTDFANEQYGKINYAQWNIAPGSSFKPYDYATLIDNGNAGAGSVLYDIQQPLPQYPCTDKSRPPPYGHGNCLQDYDFRTPGPLSLRYALGGSRNIPAVKAMLSVVPGKTEDSVNKVIGTANSMMNNSANYACYKTGADVSHPDPKDKTQCYGASAIGDGAFLHLDQHVNGIATLARMGKSIPSTYIMKIYKGTSGKPFYEWKQPKDGDKGVKQAIRPEAAYIVNNMASDPNASYLPAGYYKWHRYNGWNNGIKTGTTNNGFDGLMMGWNTKYAVGSWVGYHTRNQALSGAMEYSTTPLTRGFMTAALDSLHTPAVNWTEPSGIQHLPGFVVRTHVGIGSVEPSPATEIFPSWYKAKSSSSQSSTIDKVSNKLATSCTPPLARQTVSGNSNADQFSVDVFHGGSISGGGNTGGNDDVHSCSDSPPTVSLTATDNNDGTATLAAFVSAGTHPLNDAQYPQFPGTVTFSANGQQIGSKAVSDPQDNVSITYTATSSGTVNFTATVTDSVLYSATDSKSLNLTVGATTGPPTNLQATAGGGSVINLSWTGGVAPFTFWRIPSGPSSDVQFTCNSTGPTSCQTTQLHTGNKVYVKDSNGSDSNKAVVP